MTWPEDKDVKKAMLLIRSDIKDESVHIAECFWIYEPVINYYRMEYRVHIKQVFREDLKFEAEYILSQPQQKEIKEYGILKDYSRESGLVLYKRKPIAAN